MRQVALEQKNKTIQDLQERIDALERELAEQRTKSERRKCKNCSLSKSREEEEEARGPTEVTDGAEAQKECETTQREVETLKLKLQQAELQHRVASKDLEEALAENQSLTFSLEKAESESRELQTRLKYVEDIYEKQNADVPLASPKCPSLTSTPKHIHVTRFPFGSPGSPQSKAPHSGGADGGSTQAAAAASAGGGGERGMSLFNELDSHCSHLQSQYEDLLERCTCSASVHHRGDHTQLTPPDATTPALIAVGPGEKGKPSLERPLMELFDAMFSTLRETAQVADRLVERRY